MSTWSTPSYILSGSFCLRLFLWHRQLQCTEAGFSTHWSLVTSAAEYGQLQDTRGGYCRKRISQRWISMIRVQEELLSCPISWSGLQCFCRIQYTCNVITCRWAKHQAKARCERLSRLFFRGSKVCPVLSQWTFNYSIGQNQKNYCKIHGPYSVSKHAPVTASWSKNVYKAKFFPKCIQTYYFTGGSGPNLSQSESAITLCTYSTSTFSLWHLD